MGRLCQVRLTALGWWAPSVKSKGCAMSVKASSSDWASAGRASPVVNSTIDWRGHEIAPTHIKEVVVLNEWKQSLLDLPLLLSVFRGRQMRSTARACKRAKKTKRLDTRTHICTAEIKCWKGHPLSLCFPHLCSICLQWIFAWWAWQQSTRSCHNLSGTHCEFIGHTYSAITSSSHTKTYFFLFF